MVVEYLQVKCPSCGDKIYVENGKNDFYCSNCGFHINLNVNLDIKNIKIEKTKVIRDEARLKEAEVEMKKLDYEYEDRANRKRKEIRDDVRSNFRDYAVIAEIVMPIVMFIVMDIQQRLDYFDIIDNISYSICSLLMTAIMINGIYLFITRKRK